MPVIQQLLPTILKFLDMQDHQFWGRLYESAIGAYLANSSRIHGFHLYYWLDRNREVDFIVQKGKSLVAIEVKSGKKHTNFEGIRSFRNHP